MDDKKKKLIELGVHYYGLQVVLGMIKRYGIDKTLIFMYDYDLKELMEYLKDNNIRNVSFKVLEEYLKETDNDISLEECLKE